MVVKFINLNISSTSAPFEILVSTLNGITILSKKVMQNKSNICIRTLCNRIAITARYGAQSQTQYLYLSNSRCQCYNINFVFMQAIFNQRISLVDKNYNLPVQYAILAFNSK